MIRRADALTRPTGRDPHLFVGGHGVGRCLRRRDKPKPRAEQSRLLSARGEWALARFRPMPPTGGALRYDQAALRRSWLSLDDRAGLAAKPAPARLATYGLAELPQSGRSAVC